MGGADGSMIRLEQNLKFYKIVVLVQMNAPLGDRADAK